MAWPSHSMRAATVSAIIIPRTNTEIHVGSADPMWHPTSICVKEGEVNTRTYTYRPTICTGNPSCEGEVAWCKKDERKNEKC